MAIYYCQCCDQYIDGDWNPCIMCEKCQQSVCDGCINIEYSDETGKELCYSCKPESEE